MGKTSRRILLLVHPQFRPERATSKGLTEHHVWSALKRTGFNVEVAPVAEDIRALDRKLAKFNPYIVFNLLEEFRGEGVFDSHPVAWLETLGVPYTGCNPRGLTVSRNKLWVAQIARESGVLAPLTQPSSEKPKTRYPLFVKYGREHASLGLTKANRVTDAKELRREVKRLGQRFPGEIILQEFIPGLEVSVSVWGNQKLESFGARQLRLPSANHFATERVKFSAAYRRQQSIRSTALDSGRSQPLEQAAKKMFQRLDMSGYARFDFRLREDGEAFLIDVNANPNLSQNEDFAQSSAAEGWAYGEILEEIIRLGRAYKPSI